MNTKTASLRVRLTPEESDAFKKRVMDLDEKRGRVVRMLVREFISDEPDFLKKELAVLKLALRQVIGMANNLNQIARVMNAGITTQSLNQNQLDQVQLYLVGFKQILAGYINHTHSRSVKLP